MTCRTCAHWCEEKNECHAHAPIAISILVANNHEGIDAITVWPSVTEDEWCGEHVDTQEES
jgi:hypothetical protein